MKSLPSIIPVFPLSGVIYFPNTKSINSLWLEFKSLWILLLLFSTLDILLIGFLAKATNCNKSNKILKWRSVLSFKETSELTINWYREFYKNKKGIRKFSIELIKYFSQLLDKRLWK